MDELILKETLTKASEESYSPTHKHEISGWNDDNSIKPAKHTCSLRKKFKLQTVRPLFSPFKIIKNRAPIQQIKKPFSQYEFLSSPSNIIGFYQIKDLKNTLNRPATSGSNKRRISETPKGKTKKYSKILLNKFVNLNNSCLYNRSFSPKKLTTHKYYRRSMSSCGDPYIDPDSKLVVNGSSCTLKL